MLLPGVLAILLLSGGTQALQCYFCAGTGATMPCDKHITYTNTADCKTEEYKKNCTAPYDQMCTIETHYSMGSPFVQIRDCNDGTTFFLQSANTTRTNFDRLLNLKTDNETSCVWDGQYLVCLSKCDTDFCNGPQLDMQTCGAVTRQASIQLMCIVMSMLFVVFMRIEDSDIIPIHI